MQSIWLDLRYALRGLCRSPTFAVAAICSMAIGIGANTAVFSVFNAVLLRPFPYADPAALVALYESNLPRGLGRFTISPPDFLEWRSSAKSLQSAAAYRSWTPNLTGIDQAERLTGLRVSGGFFDLLGVQAVAGRPLRSADEAANERTAVISQAMWRRVFGGDPSIVGRTLRLDGEGYLVTGIMPASLQFPYADVDIWAPLNLDRERGDRGEHSLLAIGRLAPGMTAAQASAELRTLSLAHEADSNGHRPAVAALRDWFIGPSTRGILWALLAAVALLLLTACANVANLLLARSGARAREIVVRTAIGATRGRLLQQLVTESLLLAGIAGLAGLLISVWSVDLLLAMLPERSAYRMAPVAIDWRVLSYLMAISLGAGLAFGAVPSLRYSHAGIASMRTNPRATPQRVRAVLLAAQAALAVVLVAAAGMLTRSFLTLWQLDPGFSSTGVTTARVTLPTRLPDEAHVQFFERVIDRLAAGPQVVAAAAVTHVPMSGEGNSGFITIEGREALQSDPATRTGASRLIVTPEYFRTLEIGLRRGRFFERTDAAGAPPVVIINEAMARRFWPDQDPVGRRIKRGTPAAPFPWMIIVGVIADVRQQGLGAQPGPTVYLPLAQSPEPSLTLLVRSTAAHGATAARIRDAVRAVDRDQPIASLRSLDEIVFGSISARWLPLMWMAVFAGLALILASLGVFGVVSYAVEQRRREFGIRLALGAERSDLIRLAVRQGVVPAMIGAALGVGGATMVARINLALFSGTRPFDAPALLAAVALLGVLALGASYVPARRIADEDAAVTLRSE